MLHKRNVLNTQINSGNETILSSKTGMSHYRFPGKTSRKNPAMQSDCSPNIRLSAHFKESIVSPN
ncbi:MAG TPA: hypothetical protein VK151_08750 [Fluviicola sp.]|nr:hypothetical protein [Fluviicola sp.]